MSTVLAGSEIDQQADQRHDQNGVPVAQEQVRRHHADDEAEQPRQPQPRLRRHPHPGRQPRVQQQRQSHRGPYRPQVGRTVGAACEIANPGKEAAEDDQRRDDDQRARRPPQQRYRQRDPARPGADADQEPHVRHRQDAQQYRVDRLASVPVLRRREVFVYAEPVYRRGQLVAMIVVGKERRQLPQQQRVAYCMAAGGGGFARAGQDHYCELAVLERVLEAGRDSFIGLVRSELGRESPHRRVVGEPIAQMVQEDEQRGAEQRRRRVEEDRSAAPRSGQPPPLRSGPQSRLNHRPSGQSMLCSRASLEARRGIRYEWQTMLQRRYHTIPSSTRSPV